MFKNVFYLQNNNWPTNHDIHCHYKLTHSSIWQSNNTKIMTNFFLLFVAIFIVVLKRKAKEKFIMDESVETTENVKK